MKNSNTHTAIIYKQILQNYSDIISLTKYRIPKNYYEINFLLYLTIKYNSNELIHTNKNIKETIDSFLKDNNHDRHTSFSNFGRLVQVDFRELKYYQTSVGIEGPKNTHIDDPANIVKINNQIILYNGYHRALFKMEMGYTNINAYLLEL